ncbi:S1 family peptidase [Litoribacillus peritrichatus]|uniref:Peptidase S1 domain-containing protein n=1 Tax=Litoribacillus peritrichatus TaxID=718191 RepID=A0ABP7N5Q9_9GAMM
MFRTSIFTMMFIALLFAHPDKSIAIRGGEDITSNRNSPSHQAAYTVVAIHKQHALHQQPDSKHACSGVLINPENILTSVHCFDDQNFEITIISAHFKLTPVSVGIHNQYLRTELKDEYWQFVYDIKLENDYALVKIESLPRNPKTHTLDLSRPSFTISPTLTWSEQLFVMGYGQTANIFGMGEGEGTLRITGPLNGEILSSKRAEIRHNSKGACQGDSGGPLFSIEEDRLLLLGIISQGDCNTFSRYQRVIRADLNPNHYQWYAVPTQN